VRAGALDELFSQGEPVLAGVDLNSGYLFGLALRETRSGEDWAEVLKQGQEQGLNLAVVVKDAAKGIESGVRDEWHFLSLKLLLPTALGRVGAAQSSGDRVWGDACERGAHSGLAVFLPDDWRSRLAPPR